MKKVLAFFGAFNPPTKAHVDLAKLAMEQTESNGVVFVPSKTEYIEEEQKKDWAFNRMDRLAMLERIRQKNYLWMSFSLHDMFSDDQPKTYDTLRFLRDNQGYDPTLLVGSDQFYRMEKEWEHVPEIAEEFGIVCIPRYMYHTADLLLQTRPFYQKIAPYVTLLDVPYEYEYNDISSTRARSLVKSLNITLNELENILPAEIFDYVVVKEEPF